MTTSAPAARCLARWEAADVEGAVVVVDVIRAFSTVVAATDEAARTLRLGPEHCDPTGIELAARVDAFDFAMEVSRTELGLRLDRRP